MTLATSSGGSDNDEDDEDVKEQLLDLGMEPLFEEPSGLCGCSTSSPGRFLGLNVGEGAKEARFRAASEVTGTDGELEHDCGGETSPSIMRKVIR